MSRLTPGAHIIPICTVAELPELECTGGYRVLAAGRNYYAARQPFGILSYVIADSVRLVVLGAEMVEQHISSSSEWIHRCAASGPVLLFLSTSPPELCRLGAAAAG